MHMPRQRVYLDWAAAAPVSPRIARVFSAALCAYGNPASPHAEGRAARAVLEEARVRIARMAQAKAEGVIFTSGATEANALALLGAVRAAGVRGSHVLYQASQHASVLGAIRTLEAEGAETEQLDISRVREQLRPATVLVTMDAVNGETGQVFDTRRVRRALDEAGSGAALHVDASQLPLIGSFALAHLGADVATLDAQKVGGVRGIGCVLIGRGNRLVPLMEGGGQERGLRPGTQSPALALAFAAALADAEAVREEFRTRAAMQRATLVRALEGIRMAYVNEGAENAPHLLNISLVGRDTDYLCALLDERGFAVSTKSACESDSEEGSRAVLALSGDAERAAATMRISWGNATRDRDLARFADALRTAIRFLDENAI